MALWSATVGFTLGCEDKMIRVKSVIAFFLFTVIIGCSAQTM
jgi:hypothetical protein